MGEAIGKSMDISSMKYDVRILSGSTLPINRWAYLEELKQLMSMGVIDDVAVLAETDIRNKEKIVQRKSLYSQLQGQIQSLSQAIKDKEGTIETLERQLVQAGIKGKVMQADVEINKKKEQVKASMEKESSRNEAKLKVLSNVLANNVDSVSNEMIRNARAMEREISQNTENNKKSLEMTSENE